MRDAELVLVLTVVLVGLSLGLAVAPAIGAPSATAAPIQPDAIAADLSSAHVEACAATPPPDHADPEGGTSGTIGWVNGYWYDEPLELDPDDELTQDELEQLTARTAARVEALRCHAFEELPPLEFFTREEYRADVETAFEEVNHTEWQLADAQHAAMLIAGQSVDAKELTTDVQTGLPIAFYDTEERHMGFIVSDPMAIEIDEVVLAHELTHALQDQHFDIRRVFDRETNDAVIAGLSIAEGDASLVERFYEERCDDELWGEDCLRTDPASSGPVASFPLLLNRFAAYQTPLVAETYEAEGWDGVDALLDDMPETMYVSVHPNHHGSFEPASVTVADASTDDWQRVPRDDGNATDVIGVHGLTSILVAPAFETENSVQVVPTSEFQRPHAGGDFNYSLTATSGWRGDRLYAYTNADGFNASVWRLTWASSDSAEAFVEAYASLIEYRGGSLADGYENVYTFDGAGEYDMALGIQLDGDELTVVTAPTVDALTAVHGEFEVEPSTTTPTPVTPTPTPPDTPTPTATPPDGATPTATTPPPTDQPGLGIVVALLAVVGGALLLRYRP